MFTQGYEHCKVDLVWSLDQEAKFLAKLFVQAFIHSHYVIQEGIVATAVQAQPPSNISPNH